MQKIAKRDNFLIKTVKLGVNTNYSKKASMKVNKIDSSIELNGIWE